MKTAKRLNIQDKPGYFFMNMININDFDSNFLVIYNLQSLKIDQLYSRLTIVKKIIHHILFLIT